MPTSRSRWSRTTRRQTSRNSCGVRGPTPRSAILWYAASISDIRTPDMVAIIRKSWLVPGILIPIALIAAAAWAFIELLEEVSEGETRAIDEAIILAFRVPGDPADPIGEPWLEEAMRDITALGSAPALVIAVLAVFGFLALAKAWRPA